jgi:hypothetical protein
LRFYHLIIDIKLLLYKLKEEKMPKPDLNKIKLYLLRYAEDDFLGQYRDGSKHYFRLKRDKSGWDIIPYETSLWESLDRGVSFGFALDKWYGEGSKHIPPDWLPEIPTLDELKAISSILWKERFNN